MKDIEQDKEYQALHEAYQAESSELPPEALDKSILKAAHKAVADEYTSISPQHGVDTQPVKRAWYVPVSYVAILVISLSVVMKLALEPEMSPVAESDIFETQMYDSEKAQNSTEQNALNMASSTGLKQDAGSLGESAPAPVSRKTASSKRERVPLASSTGLSEEARQTELNNVNIEATQMLSQEKHVLQGAADSGQQNTSLSTAVKPVLKAKRTQLSAADSIEEKRRAEVSPESDISAGEYAGKITGEQKILIETMVQLYKNRDYGALEVSLKDYRKKYPIDDTHKYLPQNLLDWEAEHITELPDRH